MISGTLGKGWGRGEGDGAEPSVEPSPEGPGAARPGRVRRLGAALAAHRVAVIVVAAVLVAGGAYAWSQVRPLLSTGYRDVAYTVPDAPKLVAAPGETVYRIDPAQSSLAYGVDEKIVGQDASHAEGSTSGIAGDLAVNPDDPGASRIGQIVVNVEQFHSDNSLRDARIREDYLESHEFPLATFAATSVSGLPAHLDEGTSYSFQIDGDLTVHDQTHPVTFSATGQIADGKLTANATTQVKMSDFGVGPHLAGRAGHHGRRRLAHVRPGGGQPVPLPRGHRDRRAGLVQGHRWRALVLPRRRSPSWRPTAPRATTAARWAPSTG